MKLLYGVQATGNGHITRARVMAPLLKQAGVEVDYLFSGRPADKLFDMEPFGDYQVCKGFTFITDSGRVRIWKTLLQASFTDFFRDIYRLDTGQYDLVLTDYEPVTAWAARIKGAPSIGLGHQYAFRYDIPLSEQNPVSHWLLKWFAPTNESLAVHWHHFDQPILPPIIEVDQLHNETNDNTVLVYLPFEQARAVLSCLHQLPEYHFLFHTPDLSAGQHKNVTVYPLSKEGFRQNLEHCQSVLCNAGFELVSESLQLGRRIMVKPLAGQMEQASNAHALEQLNLGRVIHHLDDESIRSWLEQAPAIQVQFPQVAKAIVEWLVSGCQLSRDELVRSLWGSVQYP